MFEDSGSKLIFFFTWCVLWFVFIRLFTLLSIKDKQIKELNRDLFNLNHKVEMLENRDEDLQRQISWLQDRIN